jgi:hypothetical protein
MHHLGRRREKCDVDAAGGNRAHRGFERCQIVRESPLIHGHAGHVRPSRLEPSQEIGIRRAVFLNRDAAARKGELLLCAIERRHYLAPRIGLGCSQPHRYTELAKDGDRFRPARQDSGSPQRANEDIAIASDTLDDRDERASAHAGQQDDEIEFATLQRIGECDGFGIGFERHLFHRGRRNRNAAIRGDDGRHLLRTAALENQNRAIVERWTHW